jgi:ABC-type amino acid transport substrate-binding protein
MKKHPIQHTSGSFSRRDFLRASGITALTVGGMTVLTACGPAAQSSDASASSSTTTSASSDSSSSDSLKLGDGTTLRVGMEAAYAPYNWQESSASDTTIPIENVDGAYADGYDVQVAKKIADALGMEPVAVKMEFGSLVDSLVNGQIDIICAGMSVTDERAQSADFSDSYIDDEVIMVVKQDSPYANATKLSDFSGASVLGQKDTFYDDLIDQIPNVNHLTPVATVPLVVDGLMNGTCDAITFSSLSLPRLLKDYPTLKKVDLADGEGFTDASNPDNAAIAKGQDAVLAKINEVIDGISADERQSMWDDCMDRQPA